MDDITHEAFCLAQDTLNAEIQAAIDKFHNTHSSLSLLDMYLFIDHGINLVIKTTAKCGELEATLPIDPNEKIANMP